MVMERDDGGVNIRIERTKGVTLADRLGLEQKKKVSGPPWNRKTEVTPQIPTPDLHFEVIPDFEMSFDGQHFVAVGKDGAWLFLVRDAAVLMSGRYQSLEVIVGHRDYEQGSLSRFAVISKDREDKMAFHLIDVKADPESRIKTLFEGSKGIVIHKKYHTDLFLMETEDADGNSFYYVDKTGRIVNLPIPEWGNVDLIKCSFDTPDDSTSIIASTSRENENPSSSLQFFDYSTEDGLQLLAKITVDRRFLPETVHIIAHNTDYSRILWSVIGHNTRNREFYLNDQPLAVGGYNWVVSHDLGKTILWRNSQSGADIIFNGETLYDGPCKIMSLERDHPFSNFTAFHLREETTDSSKSNFLLYITPQKSGLLEDANGNPMAFDEITDIEVTNTHIYVDVVQAGVKRHISISCPPEAQKPEITAAPAA